MVVAGVVSAILKHMVAAARLISGKGAPTNGLIIAVCYRNDRDQCGPLVFYALTILRRNEYPIPTMQSGAL